VEGQAGKKMIELIHYFTKDKEGKDRAPDQIEYHIL